MVTKVVCRVGHPSADGQFCRHKKASVVLCIILACLFRLIVLIRDRSDCDYCATWFRNQSHLLVEAAQEKISLTMIRCAAAHSAVEIIPVVRLEQAGQRNTVRGARRRSTDYLGVMGR